MSNGNTIDFPFYPLSPPIYPQAPSATFPMTLPITVQPACGGVHLQGASHVTPYLERVDGREILRLKCYCCGAAWSIDLGSLR